MPPTNAQAAAGPALDFRSFTYMFRGRRPGMVVGKDVSPEDHDADKRAYEYYTKKSVDQAMAVQQPVQPPQYITLTNQADGSEVRGIMEDGKFREIPVDKITTPKGTFAMQTSTNAAPIYLPDGSVAQNYTSDPFAGGAPMPGVGGAGMAGTNAPTTTNAPTPSPTPYPEGAKIRKKSDGLLYQVVNGIPQLIPGQ